MILKVKPSYIVFNLKEYGEMPKRWGFYIRSKHYCLLKYFMKLCFRMKNKKDSKNTFCGVFHSMGGRGHLKTRALDQGVI